MKRLNTILLIDDDAPTLFLNQLVIQDLDCTDKILTLSLEGKVIFQLYLFIAEFSVQQRENPCVL